MTTQTNEQIIVELKSRILDTQDVANKLQSQNQELSQCLIKIAEIVHAPTDENGNIQLLDLIEAVKSVYESTLVDSDSCEK